jgi:hypothetical protein
MQAWKSFVQACWLDAAETLSAKMAAATAGNNAIAFMVVLTMPFASRRIAITNRENMRA